MPVLISNEITEALPVNIAIIQRAAEKLLQLTGREQHELSIMLVDDNRMAELNSVYRHKKGATNVLAFAMQETKSWGAEKDSVFCPLMLMLGDVIISVDTAVREAQDGNITLLQQLIILLIHGFLHLLGYDHERSPEAMMIMENEEKKLLAQL